MGSPVTGSGSPITFGLQTVADTYTVVATRTAGGCTANMTGSAIVMMSVTGELTASSGWTQPVSSPPTAAVTLSNPNGLNRVGATTLTLCAATATARDASDSILAIIPLDLSGGYVLGTQLTLPQGTTKVEFLATKNVSSPGNPAIVNVFVNDACNQLKTTDPVITTLEVLAGSSVQQRIEGVAAPERYLQVFNGNPGLKSVEASLNGRNFRLDGFTDGQSLVADLGSAMLEGENNVFLLTGYGEVGASALVLLTDSPSGQLVEPTEIVKLTLNHTTAGLTLSWPVTLAGWHLQASTSPEANWSDLSAPPVAAGSQWTLTVPASGAAQFYRLQGPVGAHSTVASTTRTIGTNLAAPSANQPQPTKHTYGGHTF